MTLIYKGCLPRSDKKTKRGVKLRRSTCNKMSQKLLRRVESSTIDFL